MRAPHLVSSCLFPCVHTEAVPLTLQPHDYILDAMSMCERESVQYSLCFRRNTWLKPLRVTNNLMVDVLYYQVRWRFSALNGCSVVLGHTVCGWLEVLWDALPLQLPFSHV